MDKLVRSVISVSDLDLDYIKDICERAVHVYRELREGNRRKFVNYLTGEKCDLIFSQESTRTYSSFEDAFSMLGAGSIVGFRSAGESSMQKGESIYHTVDTFVGQGSGSRFLVIRHGAEGSAKWARVSAFRSFAKKVREYAKEYYSYPGNLIFPIIFNGGDGKHSHPSQLLLDCATIYHKFGRITDLDFGECNDIGGSRVVSSHIDAAATLNWRIHASSFPDAGFSLRQRYRFLKSGIRATEYDSVEDMLPNLDLLYVNRYQFNLRGGSTGDFAGNIFSKKHPRISLSLVKPHRLPVFHARPIDKNAREITPDLYDHPLDCSGVQSDFGVPTRMAMCMHAIDNRMFSLEGIIRSFDPEELGFYVQDLSGRAPKVIEEERYTTARIHNGYVIDHIPRGCGGVISNLISKLFPDIQVVLSMNVRGAWETSTPKDVIKLHVPGNFRWDPILTNIVVLFTEYSAKKSCRVSRFAEGTRVEKWAYRIRAEGGDRCVNRSCITRDEHNENIVFLHRLENVGESTLKVCPYCETPQDTKLIEALERDMMKR
jgi:aspartate carbamoyltransferase catalytic subunit